MEVGAMGIPWYSPDDWPALKSLFVDRDKLHRRYEDWLTSAEVVRSKLKAEGHFVIRVPIVPEVFESWCRASGHVPDARARARYASIQARDAIVAREEANSRSNRDDES